MPKNTEMKNVTIEKWIDKKFENLKDDIKLKLKQKLFENNIKYNSYLYRRSQLKYFLVFLHKHLSITKQERIFVCIKFIYV